jgi:alkanesulfonate monooxygenase SsuD/methylene tetrahydromethanopterin reductase-like flavin-dependent oxidoreductase (luciferase family)
MAENTPAWSVHPWVTQRRGKIGFGVAWGQDAGATWSEFRDFVRLVEESGLDSYWAIDHPLGSVSGLDCWTALTSLAATTKTLRLGSLVSCVYYRSPFLLARLAADVDRISGGRLILGVGIGDSAPEFRGMGLPFPPAAERQRALEETIDVVRGLWGPEPFSFAGEHFRVTDGTVRPPPMQEPRVPVLIAGGGERVTLAQVARHADLSNFGAHAAIGSAFGTEDIVRKCAVLRGHCEAVGRPYDSILRTHTTMPLFLAETPVALRAKLDAVPQGFRDFLAPSTVAGTPDEAVAHYRSLVRAGMQYFIAFIYPKDAETVRLLAEQVVPRLAVSHEPN